jgi:hypothetical protein
MADGARDVRVTFVDERSVFQRSADVLVCQRHATASVAEADRLIEHCRSHGMRLVYDIDDELITIPDRHPEADHLRSRSAVVLRFVLAADRVWAATPELARQLGRLRHDVEVVPNAIDDRLWQPPPSPPTDGLVRIVYMGTATHDGELALRRAGPLRGRGRHVSEVAFRVVSAGARGGRRERVLSGVRRMVRPATVGHCGRPVGR